MGKTAQEGSKNGKNRTGCMESLDMFLPIFMNFRNPGSQSVFIVILFIST